MSLRTSNRSTKHLRFPTSRLEETIKRTYGGFGIDLERFQGNGGWFLPIPATLVVGQDGLVKARCVERDFRHRLAIEDNLAAIFAQDVTNRAEMAGSAGVRAERFARQIHIACRHRCHFLSRSAS